MMFIRYTVEGVGEFPADMLRYDMVWPVDSGDAERITTPSWERRRIELEGDSGRCTPRRWASFGWNVVDADDYFADEDGKILLVFNS
jgi:hypothetical protein